MTIPAIAPPERPFLLLPDLLPAAVPVDVDDEEVPEAVEEKPQTDSRSVELQHSPPVDEQNEQS